MTTYGGVTVTSTDANTVSTTSFNSRDAATLAASGTFQGVSEDVSKYGRAGIAIKSDNATDGVLTIEVSHDNVKWSAIPRTWENTSIAQPHMWVIVEKYFRIKYVNGTTEATNLSIQVQYSSNSDILLGHQLNETLIDETEAIITRSVAVAQNPNNVYINNSASGVDNGNSSSTNLTAATSLVFTGTWLDISNYVGISVLVEGAASGTVAGTLQMQFSHDGVNVHRDVTVNDVDVENTQPRTLGVIAQYFRVIYTAASDLTAFDIQTMLHMQQVQLVSRLNQSLTGTEDVTNVRSIMTGVDLNGVYQNVETLQHEGKTSLYTIAGFSDTESVHLDIAVPATDPVAYMLVDVSDTTNWPHTNTGHVVIEYMILEVDPGSTFAGEVKIGYLKNVDATDGDFVTLIDVDMQKQAVLLVENIDFGSHGLHCDDAHHFGTTTENSTLFQTDVNLGGPDDATTLTYPSGDGDIVLMVTGSGAGNAGVNVSITLGYESVA